MSWAPFPSCQLPRQCMPTWTMNMDGMKFRISPFWPRCHSASLRWDTGLALEMSDFVSDERRITQMRIWTLHTQVWIEPNVLMGRMRSWSDGSGAKLTTKQVERMILSSNCSISSDGDIPDFHDICLAEWDKTWIEEPDNELPSTVPNELPSTVPAWRDHFGAAHFRWLNMAHRPKIYYVTEHGNCEHCYARDRIMVPNVYESLIMLEKIRKGWFVFPDLRFSLNNNLII